MNPHTTNTITFISAGAGSGKTYRLTELLSEELTSKASRPSGVIATTFTNWAATELRERVRSHLMTQGLFSLANTMGQALIGTVNSVCGQLVSRFAFEAGLSPDQNILDEDQSGALLSKAVDAVVNPTEINQLLALCRRLGLEDGWKATLQTLVNQIRSNLINPTRMAAFATENADDLLSHFPSPTQRDLDTELLNALANALPAVRNAADQSTRKNTKDYLNLITEFDEGLRQKTTTWAQWNKIATETAPAQLRELHATIANIAEQHASHPGLHRDIRDYLHHIFDLAGRALQHYQSIKRELGLLDFTDQEHQLLILLDNPEVTAVLQEELDVLMVDEFQDTNPIQLALFLKLAQCAKRIYWVGDVKQAIYGFRGSDNALMKAVVDALPSLGGRKDVLSESWRSRPELVKLVNAVFSKTFAGTLQPQEIQLTPTRANELTGPAFANWMLEGTNIEQEASALASGVHALVASEYRIFDKQSKTVRPVRFGDIAILAASHERITQWVKALSEQDIPVATERGGLLKTAEVTLAFACLRRLVDPDDTLATAQIVSLAESLEPEVWVADRLNYLANPTNTPKNWLEHSVDGHPAHPILECISQLRTSLTMLAPREALATIIAACGLPEKVVRWSSDPDRARIRLTNLESLLDLATHYEMLCQTIQEAASVSGLILWLEKIEQENLDLLAEPGINAVKVLTHHAAKGLEWPVVILTDLAKEVKDQLWSISASAHKALDIQAPLADRFIRYWPKPFGQQKKVGVHEIISESPIALTFRKAAIEEHKRLLYVSMTRARDLLVFARSSRKPVGPWLDCLDAPWLLPETDPNLICMPHGETLLADYWVLSPGVTETKAQAAAANNRLFWFNQRQANKNPLPLFISASTTTSNSYVALGEHYRIGKEISLNNVKTLDTRERLGTALHACIARWFTDPCRTLTEEEIQQILDDFNVAEHLAATDLLQQIQLFHQWIDTRWPKATAHAEIPVENLLPSGQILSGRIDLLLETDDGWVLIDHKSSQAGQERWELLVEKHGPQLMSYHNALERSSNKPVKETWLFLPISGSMISMLPEN